MRIPIGKDAKGNLIYPTRPKKMIKKLVCTNPTCSVMIETIAKCHTNRHCGIRMHIDSWWFE